METNAAPIPHLGLGAIAFVLVMMMVQFASDIQWYKRMGRLLWKILTGSGRDAACAFCDEVRLPKVLFCTLPGADILVQAQGGLAGSSALGAV